ncbi:DUF4190 domain-containing protein [Kitasatospora sp. NPDC050463]|uniref:DUF4190 domain-containing protein n=1 Tax=Kitasatospora sp. NPDC050463 TaxID=3155786 RepID=UPI0034061699
MNTRTTATAPGRTASPRAAGADDPPGHGRQPPAGGDGPAVAALVLGVTGLLTSVVFVGGLLGVLGLVLGVVALGAGRRTGVGRGKAVAGLVTSCIAIVLSVLMAFFMVWYADNTQECYRPDTFRQYTQCVHEQLTGN